MPVIIHPKGTPLPDNSPLKGSRIIVGVYPQHYLRELAKSQLTSEPKDNLADVLKKAD